MKKLCIINQKGGVGKTTSAVNIAAGLSREGKRVLLVDVDPQGNIAHSLTADKRLNLYHFLTGECSHVDCITSLGKNLDLIHSNESLTKMDSLFATIENPARLFTEKFSDVAGYDYVVFDCAPSLGLLNQNVMLFSQEALIPVSTNYLSLTGLASMIEAIEDINNHYGHDLKVKYVVPTLHDIRNKLNKDMLVKLKEDHGDLVTKPIRINSKLAEAPSSGKSIFSYAKASRGAKDYAELVKSILSNDENGSHIIPISQRVQKMMAHIEIED